VAFEDVDGKAASFPALGLPILLKQLEGHGADKPTHTWTAALDLPDELPKIDVSKRHFYLASNFGPIFASGSLDTAPLAKIVKASGSFDVVDHYTYVRVDEIDHILTHSHPFDVLFWLGQGIREEAKTNQVYKPIGMTANSGVVGETRYARERLVEKIGANPLQGPGLVVLAACESMGDGNGGGEMDKAIPNDLDNDTRLLVGFERCGDARDILAASHLFVKEYVGGQNLGDAIAQANEYLTTQESDARMVTLKDADLTTRFRADVSTFWDSYTDDGTPGDSTFQSNLNIVNQCTDSEGKTYQENEAAVTPWANNVKWNGPFFSGDRKNPDNKVDLKVSGALINIEAGAHFFFVVSGSFSPKVQGITVYGNAVIDEIKLDKKKPDEFAVVFKGQGVASTYTNEAGHACVMQDPYLVSPTGEPSQLTLPVSWKAAE